VAATGEFDLRVAGGRFHARRFGAPDDPLVICLPGLSANLAGFDYVAERVAGDGLQLVAVDLRGRGRSELTPLGTYGWPAHARDCLDLASALGADRFSVVGQSMGGAVAMEAAALAGARIRRLVLIDICGDPDSSTVPLIRAAVERLGTVHPSLEGYLAAVRGLGTIRPWSEYWERYFEYELEPVAGGVRARSDRGAVLEDLTYGEEHSAHDLWPRLTMPVLLLRATQELQPGAGHIVPVAERDRFTGEVPGVRVVEVDVNHYGINAHRQSAAAIREFLTQA
jgi:pimeloyl-ACP methyl ester carboxylesterase